MCSTEFLKKLCTVLAAKCAPTFNFRSPSPEPIYNHEGKRLNTRDVRWRKRIETERHEAVQEMLKLNPHYHIPPDYKAPDVKIQDKVFIPVGSRSWC